MNRWVAFGAMVILHASGCLRELPAIPGPVFGGRVTAEIAELKGGEATPAEGARLELFPGVVFAAADERGLVHLEGLPIGVSLRLAVRRPRDVRPTVLLDPIALTADGQALDLGRIVLGAAGLIEGTVRLADRDDDRAAAGALVLVTPTAVRGVVDAQGHFVVHGVPQGVHEIVVSRPDYAPARASGVRVLAGTIARVPEVVLVPELVAPSVAVQGRVRLREGPPADGVRVTVVREVDGGASGTAVSDFSGTWATSLTTGVHRALFVRDGYTPVLISGLAVLAEGAVTVPLVILEPARAGDLDGDGVLDADDADADGDGCLDVRDRAPTDPLVCGEPGASLLDDTDGDGLVDAEELSPGRDGWLTDPERADTDGDTVTDAIDVCPLTADVSQLDRDGDGRGDACDADVEITRVSPSSGGPGTQVVIEGRSLAGSGSRTLVDFGGALALPETSEPERLSVRVPAAARTERVRVLAPAGEARSESSFVVVSGPVVLGVRPGWTRAGGTVEVIGSGFSAGVVAVTVGGQAALAGSVTLDEGAADPPRERFALTVQGTTSGLVRVETAAGVALSPSVLEVVAPPQVDTVSPTVVRVGETIIIRGSRFGTDITGGAVSVRFAGGAALRPDLALATELRVPVPSGAMDGPIEVVHPAGIVASAMSLDVVAGAAAPSLRRLVTTIAERGQQVRIEGTRLGSTRSVTFPRAGGGARVASPSWTASEEGIAAVVPEAAAPGPIEVEVAPAGEPVLRGMTAEALRLVRRGALRFEPGIASGGVVGFGFGMGGGSVVMAGSTGLMTVLDATTLATTRTEVLAGDAGRDAYAFQALGAVGLLSTPAGTRVVDLATFAVRGACALHTLDTTQRRTSAFVTSGSFAYALRPTGLAPGNDGLLRVDLQTGACTTVGQRAGLGTLSALAFAPGGALWVGHRTLGLATLDPATSRFGAFGGVGVVHTTLIAASTTLFWAVGGPTIERIDSGGVTPPLVLPGAGAAPPESEVAVSFDRRFAVYTALSPSGVPEGVVLDLGAARVVGTFAADARTALGVAAHPSSLAFVAPVSGNALVRWDVEE